MFNTVCHVLESGLSLISTGIRSHCLLSFESDSEIDEAVYELKLYLVELNSALLRPKGDPTFLIDKCVLIEPLTFLIKFKTLLKFQNINTKLTLI